MSGPFCEARGLRRSYGARFALDGVDLALDAGTVVGIAGPNGAGKTTLARIVAGFLQPSAGHLRVGGLPPLEHRARRGVGYLPEEAPRLWQCSLRQLLRARPGQGGGGLDAESLPLLLDIGHLADTSLARLSKGQWRLALTAYALLGPSPLVVLDEPDSGLDPAALDRLGVVVRRAARAGALVLILSHQLPELETACDRVLFMAAGRVVGQAAPRELPRGGLRSLYRELVG